MAVERAELIQRLEILRWRLIKALLAVAVGFVVCFHFKEHLLQWLMEPMLAALPADGMQQLAFLAPQEALMTYLKVSFIGGLGLAMPVVFFQLWRILAGALFGDENKYLVSLVVSASLCFSGGCAFAYYVVFPYGFKFFTSFSSEHITPVISTGEYLSFAIRFLLAFGLIFELPIFVFFLAKLGLVTAPFLRRQRRYAVLLIFVVAAVLTPTPDAFTQCLMAGPLLILYEVSIGIAQLVGGQGREEAQSP
jgi:sec-independent protein translocase protein TatC